MQKILIGIILSCIVLLFIFFYIIKDIDTTKLGQYYFCKSKKESQKKGFYITEAKLSKQYILLNDKKIVITDAWIEKLKQYDSHGNLMILNIKEKGSKPVN